MRIKKDYMGNDQLLPAYNVQVGVADEYIAVVDVNQYRSDMDCFIPLMNKFYTTLWLFIRNTQWQMPDMVLTTITSSVSSKEWKNI